MDLSRIEQPCFALVGSRPQAALSVEDNVRSVLRREAADAAEALGWNADLAEDIAFEEFKKTREGIPWEEVKPWLESLATDDPLPRPKARKLP